jgi:hypothetical protein
MGLGRARDGDEALGGDPGEGDLRGGAALFGGELPHLADNGAVLVEVLALELGDWVSDTNVSMSAFCRFV